MDAVIIEDPLRIIRLARHVGLGEFRPEAGRLDQLRRRHVIGMGIDPVGRRRSTAAVQAKDAASFARASSVASRLRLGRPRFSRQSSPRTAVAAAVSRARISGVPKGVGSPSVRSRIPTRQPSSLNFMIAPAIPSSASSGWGANNENVEHGLTATWPCL